MSSLKTNINHLTLILLSLFGFKLVLLKAIIVEVNGSASILLSTFLQFL